MNHPVAIRLRELLGQVPFHPFTVRMVDGKQYHIPHADFLTITRSGVVTFDDGEGTHRILNVTLVLEIIDAEPANP